MAVCGRSQMMHQGLLDGRMLSLMKRIGVIDGRPGLPSSQVDSQQAETAAIDPDFDRGGNLVSLMEFAGQSPINFADSLRALTHKGLAVPVPCRRWSLLPVPAGIIDHLCW